MKKFSKFIEFYKTFLKPNFIHDNVSDLRKSLWNPICFKTGLCMLAQGSIRLLGHDKNMNMYI